MHFFFDVGGTLASLFNDKLELSTMSIFLKSHLSISSGVLHGLLLKYFSFFYVFLITVGFPFATSWCTTELFERIICQLP